MESKLTRYLILDDGRLRPEDGSPVRLLPAPVYLAAEVDAALIHMFREGWRSAENTKATEATIYLTRRMDQAEKLLDATLIEKRELRAEVARLTRDRDEYKALASVGAWHTDCRPNRRKAAEEIQKSQQRIDVLALEVAALTRELDEAKIRLASLTPSDGVEGRPTVLNAYGRQCYNAGRIEAERERDAARAALAAVSTNVDE